MNKRIEGKIKKVYEAVFNKIFKEVKKNNAETNKQEIANIILKFEKSKQYKAFAKKFAIELAKMGMSTQRGLWKEFYKAAKEKGYIALPKTYTLYQERIFKKAVIHNFRLISSIPKEVKDVYKYKYVTTLMSQVEEGSIGRGSFEKVLKESGAIRAKLIARTETAKLQTAISEDRSSSLGSVCYQWLSSNDKRTRQSHRDMNKVIVFWRKDSEKPLLDDMRGNAGEFPNCRCAPQPIFDERDLTENMYDVYDYRIDRVVKMTKQQLLNCIKNKQIV